MSTTRSPAAWLPAGPEPLGLWLGADASVDDDGWLSRGLVADPHLHGPRGILQGGLAVGALLAAARLGDRFDAPPTAVDARLHAPTPLDTPVTARIRATAAAHYDAVTVAGDTTLVAGTVELAGHEPAPRVPDLHALATVPLPAPHSQDAFPHCWVCGPDNDDGLRLLPAWHTDEQIVTGWIPDDDHDDGRGFVHPVVVAAVLDCPTVWASMQHIRALGCVGSLLGGYHVQYFASPRIGEPLRTVARFDSADGRKIRARSALVDEDGVVYATASAFQLAVTDIPRR